MDIVSGPVADLPEAAVGIAPAPHRLVGVTGDCRPGLRVKGVAGGHEGPERIDHPAGHIQLSLVGGQVAVSDRPAPFVPGQAWQLLLARHLAAVNAVHGPQPLPTGSMVDEPAQERLGFVRVSGRDHCRHADAGIARPRITVVPIADAADLLGQ